ncbi:MAG: hypothetical protein KF819_15910 [Labilithrix sp.]|nr:hypothetical protein [Labilithrix sp.]
MQLSAGHASWILFALALSLMSIIASLVAILRISSLATSVQRRHRFAADELAVRVRRGLGDLEGRLTRAKDSLAETEREAPEPLRERRDDLCHRLDDVEKDVARVRSRAETHLTSTAASIEEALSRRLRRVEAGIQILSARAAARRAERLAEAGRFAQAEDLLEDAVAKVREVQGRLDDDAKHAQAFAKVIETLHDAIHSVRARARETKHDIASVLDASESLLASLEMPERALA